MAKRPRSTAKAKSPAAAAASASEPAAAPSPAPAVVSDPVLAVAENAAAAAAARAEDIEVDGRTLRVRSVTPSGRRRAGRAFGPDPIDLQADDLDDAAVAAILGDPQLLVEVVDPSA